MRVLFITTRFPGAGFRGDQLRAWQQLRYLGAQYEITLLSLDPDATSESHARALAALCRGGVLHWPRSRSRLALGALSALPRPDRALQSGMYRSRRLQARLRQLCASTAFDLVHLQLVRLADLLPVLPADLPCVVDLVDALSLNMQRRAARESWSRRWLFALEAQRLAALEAGVIARAAACTISAPADAQRLDAAGAAGIALVPNGVDLAAFPWAAAPAGTPTLLFFGNLGYFPNVDAACWLLEELLPALRARRPDTRLQLVGARPPPRLAALARRTAGAQLVGEVPDLLPWLHGATVVVAPLRAGSGQQIKLIEAMAAGTPVVSTAPSAQAMSAVDGQHLLLAESTGEFVAAIERLQDEPELARALSKAARGLVEDRYTWAASAQALAAVWQKCRGPHL